MWLVSYCKEIHPYWSVNRLLTWMSVFPLLYPFPVVLPFWRRSGNVNHIRLCLIESVNNEGELHVRMERGRGVDGVLIVSSVSYLLLLFATDLSYKSHCLSDNILLRHLLANRRHTTAHSWGRTWRGIYSHPSIVVGNILLINILNNVVSRKFYGPLLHMWSAPEEEVRMITLTV